MIVRGHSGPIAVKTTLGWVLSGPAEMTGRSRSTTSLVTTHTLRVDCVTNQELEATLHSFWDLESLGIRGTSDPVLDQFSNNLQMKGGRYEVSLPWREQHNRLPDNFDLSRRKLFYLLRRLKHNPEILREYDAIIRDQLTKESWRVLTIRMGAQRFATTCHTMLWSVRTEKQPN